ncbi:hypothetical protein [Kitasatospora sp. HPMI-4]|uniref:hypothetical protein n=1 Tax=Kitasatospora sp. HPMI-4 TaxID=3448443 RepID=UPI003F1C108B
MTDVPNPEDDQEQPQQPVERPLEPVSESDTMRQLREAARAATARSLQEFYVAEGLQWP